MTDHDNSQGEPTMEEILASIRRIISEDNDESETAAPMTAKQEANDTEPVSGGTDQMAKKDESEVFELSPNQMVEDEKGEPAPESKPNGLYASTSYGAGTESKPEPAAMATAETKEEAPATEKPAEPVRSESANEIEETLLSPEVATAAAAAFGALSKDVVVTKTGGVKSLEDLVKEMMKPMLKEWMDENLPPLIEDVVEREVQRLSHRRVRR